MREADHNMCRLGGGGKWIGHPSKSSECGEWTYQQPAIRLFSFGWATSTSKYCCCLLPAGVAGDVALLLAWLAGGGLLLLLLLLLSTLRCLPTFRPPPPFLKYWSGLVGTYRIQIWASLETPTWERTTEDRHVTGHTKRLCDMKLPV